MKSDLLLSEQSTEFNVFREDLEFSTITKFLPGLIRAAFQNSVPKSMPNTWALIDEKRDKTIRMAMFVIDLLILL